MYTTNIQTAKDIISADFPDRVITHRNYLTNTVASEGYASSGSGYDSTVELMSEEMVYGTKEYKNDLSHTSIANNYTIDCQQLPVFRLKPDYRLLRTRRIYNKHTVELGGG